MNDDLRTDRILDGSLVLRPWLPGDLGVLLDAYRDPAIQAGSRAPVADEEAAADWLRAQDEGRASGLRHSFAVVDTALGDGPVGNVVLVRPSPGSDAAEVGYWTAAPARGRGIAPRALEALTGWTFTSPAGDGLVRLDLLHQEDNEASCRVAEKAGYAFAEVLPAHPPWPLAGHRHERRAAGR
ncbi:MULTISPECIES: GNAT family N-acetyltransferase [unclassified Streptomyces]|uniref:GNAT family N-acetyltransferase n=1 Tax=unclassified Streptomyces TaxID=2593676 RepID=UPI00224F6D8B|nr:MULTISPECIES: GNAT family N-acetyltransferase [unclassified Streptomyces]MCX5140591.1 GNAT family N-acetyltransferase [Streptomyces sp. NBC_00338]